MKTIKRSDLKCIVRAIGKSMNCISFQGPFTKNVRNQIEGSWQMQTGERGQKMQTPAKSVIFRKFSPNIQKDKYGTKLIASIQIKIILRSEMYTTQYGISRSYL